MNLIFSAFATLAGYKEGDAANLGRTTYDRCTVVALCSAKAQNPGCTVALVTNTAVPQPFLGQLQAAGVEIYDCPFASFGFGAHANWALAYYKLCALDFVLQQKTFERYLMLDVDTYTQYPFDDLWREADDAVLMYAVPHAASQPMAAAISAHYNLLYPAAAPHTLTHFGGEFICGSRAVLQGLMALCHEVYDKMQAADCTPKEGDEAIWSAAAYLSGKAGAPVRPANAYVMRYWLGGRFYYVSTNYCLDPVCTLHLPGAAKDRQLPLIYRYYAKHGAFPPAGRVHSICCLPAARPPILRTIWVRLCARLYK